MFRELGRAALELPRSQYDGKSRNGIWPAGCAEHRDDLPRADGITDAATREAPGFGERPRNYHVGNVQDGAGEIVVRVLDIGVIEQHEGVWCSRCDALHVRERRHATGRIVR